jgi:hypothetical protein
VVLKGVYMPKPVILVGGIVAAVVVVGGVVAIVNKNDSPSDNSSKTSTSDSKKVALDDPNGDYKLFSDPSVTKHPEDGAVFGNGQVLTFEYDGSKTNNDPDATLSYQLYYIQEDGKVQPMGGGNVEGEGGKGVFKTAEGDKVFNSSAKGRTGFLELQGTYDSDISGSGQITGKNVKLGMYAIKFDIAD